MKLLNKAVRACSKKARQKRALLFKKAIFLDENTKILDLGSETGANINLLLQGTLVKPENVYIADIDSQLLEKGQQDFGYVPVLINETQQLPFADGYFDIVYCSSVIEHVTVAKEQVWTMHSDQVFKHESLAHQKQFAAEIQRVGKQYFVQTPYKYFLIESHCWLPGVAWLPRKILLPFLKWTNTFWVKQTNPDWYLLDKHEMSSLFKDGKLIPEKFFGFTKSIIAVKSFSGFI